MISSETALNHLKINPQQQTVSKMTLCKVNQQIEDSKWHVTKTHYSNCIIHTAFHSMCLSSYRSQTYAVTVAVVFVSLPLGKYSLLTYVKQISTQSGMCSAKSVIQYAQKLQFVSYTALYCITSMVLTVYFTTSYIWRLLSC